MGMEEACNWLSDFLHILMLFSNGLLLGVSPNANLSVL